MSAGSTLRLPRPLVKLTGAALLAGGIAVALLGLPDLTGEATPPLYERIAEWQASDAGFPKIEGHFPVRSAIRYRLNTAAGDAIELTTAQYLDAEAKERRAIVYPGGPATGVPTDASLRDELWRTAAKAIENHAGTDALFISWWDDAQRIHFLTGRETWIRAPAAEAFPEAGSKALWADVSGGFAASDALKQWARWLTMDADAALAEMASALPADRDVYFLVCLDDLARLSEIEALSGTQLPFEMRRFPATANLHGQIAAVKQWAHEGGTGNYLVQQLQNGEVRAWRVTTDAGSASLLARLLPFTGSLAKPLPQPALVYQSGWGAYLSVYQWRR